MTAITRNADFVIVALVAALTAVTRVRLRVDAGVVVALLGTHSAILHANAVLAAWGIARTDVTDRAAVLGARLQIDALAVDQCQVGFAYALAGVAILVVLALVIAATATIRVVLGILAIVAVAIRQTADASARAAITQAERVVAIVAAIATVVDVDLQIRTAIKAGVLAYRTNALTSRASAIDTVLTTRAAVVRIAGDISARIAARYFPGRTCALAIGARRAERTEEAASAAVLFIGAEFHAADVRTAIDGAGTAGARTRNAHAIRTALVAAHAAVVGIRRQVCAGILRITRNLTHGTSGTRARDAHLPIEAIIATGATVVQVFG